MKVFGVSFDDAAANAAFADKYEFNFPLLCDTDKRLSIAYGAAADASARYPNRVTYLIDAEGRIALAEEVADIDAHVAQTCQLLGA